MLVDERRHLIAEIVIAQGAATVPGLSERFGVSQVTIRSDLEALEKQGKLTRNRGGAVANRLARFIPAFQESSSVNLEAKQAIARQAALLAQDDDWILLDAGSTTLLLAEELLGRRMTIATNSIYAINKLIESADITLISLGGTLYKPVLSHVGSLAEAALDQLHFDRLFLGVNGFTNRGPWLNNPSELGIKRAMIRQSGQVIALADSSKLGVESSVLISPLREIDALITDAAAPESRLEKIRRVHPKLEVFRA
jgi:DeoR/GlpR family transcriptional regulator of sugar metabolism